MIFEIIREGEKTDWVGKEWAGLLFPQGKNGPAYSFPREKNDWGGILACYTAITLLETNHYILNKSKVTHKTIFILKFVTSFLSLGN